MRVGVVVQRYGHEVNGGAEVLCREWATHLAAHPSIDSVRVLTTCARDHERWANYYPSGTEQLDGVTVERYPVIYERALRAQKLLSPFVIGTRLFPVAEPAWFAAQGPACPGLWRRLWTSSRADEFDAYLFVTYLYATTVLGLPLVARRAVLAPTAHDEPTLRLMTFRGLFKLPRAFAYLTSEEQALVQKRFDVAQVPSEVVGTGITIPGEQEQGDPSRLPEGPYLLYVGRIESSKGFPRFFDEFERFKREHAEDRLETRDGKKYRGKDLKLVLAGRFWGEVPQREDIVCLGFVSEAEKLAAYRMAQALVLPSRYESLSIVILEAWAQRCPVLVDGHCEVTSGQVLRSGGGDVFRGAEGFSRAARDLLGAPALQRQYGERGRAYVEQNYAWPRCTERLVSVLQRAAAQ